MQLCRRTARLAVLAGCVLALAGCATGVGASRHPARPAGSGSSTVPAVVRTATPATEPARRQLPRGGTTILGHYRVVAFYGGPDGPALGALGDGSPAHMARVIERRAGQWAGYGLPVQPAMELIATVAQGSPGPDGLYSAAIPAAAVQRYLDVAHRYQMLLILDIQPGRGDFLPQVRQFARFLRDPSVEVALDPEWKVGPGQVPGQVIGSARAASINRVERYLSQVVARYRLPDKLVMVHEFTPQMLPNRAHIDRLPGLEVVFHADGFGDRAEKVASYQRLALPGRPFGAGFKLFFTQDSGGLMSPAQVMALRPRPDVITYQ